MKKKRFILIGIIVILLGIFTFFQMTGFYIDPPRDKDNPGSVTWFYRRLMNVPFIFSADSIALRDGTNPTKDTRQAISQNVFSYITRFTIRTFPFNKRLYLLSTGNRDFLQEPGKNTN